jgi:hypothetical protein
MVISQEELTVADIEVDHIQEETTEGLNFLITSLLQSMGRFSMKDSTLKKQLPLHQLMMVLFLQVHQSLEEEEIFRDHPEMSSGDNLKATISFQEIISDKAIV